MKTIILELPDLLFYYKEYWYITIPLGLVVIYYGIRAASTKGSAWFIQNKKMAIIYTIEFISILLATIIYIIFKF